MRNTFEEYAKSSAFRIDLSTKMIEALLHVVYHEPDLKLILAPYHALQRRGLVSWNIGNEGADGIFANEAGRKVAELLKLAGYGTQQTQQTKKRNI